MAALLLRGIDRWPGVAIGALLSGTLTDWHWPSATVAASYAAGEALLATALLRWGGPFDRSLQNVRTVLRFVASVTLAAAVTAVVGAWNLIFVSLGGATGFGETWLTFWVGDAMAMLTVTPTLLVWAGTRVHFPGRWRRVEFAALLASAFVVGTLVFGQRAWPAHIVLPVAYTTFPLMVWSAFRFGQPGVTAVTATVATLALVGSGRGFGPFSHAVTRIEAVLVAGFMSVVGVTALMLAALVQERTRAQTERRASEARFRAFMQHSPAIAFMKASDGRYVFGNQAWAAQFGQPAELLLGQTDFELWPEETATRFQDSDRKALMSRQPIEMVQFGPGHDGVRQWWTTLKFLVEQDEAPPLIGGIAIDITPRIRAEQALRASEDRYRSLVELAGSVIVVLDAEGRITEFNREAETFFGSRGADALLRQYVDCCVSEPHRAAVAADLARIRTGEPLQGRESAFVQRDGTHKSFLWNATRVTDSAGGSPQLLVIGQDISELRPARAPVPAGTENGSHRPARRRHRARLQQPAHRDPRPRRDGCWTTSRRPIRRGGDIAEIRGRAARRRPHPSAARLQPQADHRAADRRPQRPGAERGPHAAAIDGRRHRAGDGRRTRISGASASTRASSSRCW